jgi:succinate-semialdehyde dehydrogenase/glutarate-semialdehyde dehydrogenase
MSFLTWFQTCVSANRFIIQEKVFDTFVEKLKNKMANLKLGDGTKPDVNQGPLINMKQVEKVNIFVHRCIFTTCVFKYSLQFF